LKFDPGAQTIPLTKIHPGASYDLWPCSSISSEEHIRKQLLEVADTMPLAPMAAAPEKKVRAFVKETVGDLLINKRTN
jgi:hypothetical protein